MNSATTSGRWESHSITERVSYLEGQVGIIRSLLIANVALSASVLAAVMLR